MLRIAPLPPFIRHERPRVVKSPPALTLVSATYEPGSSVTLVFDRAVNVDAFESTAVVVEDGEFAYGRFVGDGAAMLVDAVTVLVLLTMDEGWGTPGVRLSVSAGNGIVASGDGAAWSGVSDVALPFE